MSSAHRPCGTDVFLEGITNGAAWSVTKTEEIFSGGVFVLRYPVCGSMQDFNYLASNCFDVTLEVGCRNFPPGKELLSIWNDNKRSLIQFIWQVRSALQRSVVLP